MSEEPDDPADGPPDPQLDPERSPGFGSGPESLEDIDVGRDVTLGEADPEELTSSDTSRAAGRSAEALTATLSEGSATERRRAALALATKDAEEPVVGALARAARTDEDDDVRQFAVEALGKLGGDVAESTAREVAGDDEPWVRAEAVVALDRLDRERHADRIDAALDDDHHAVRRNAAISLFKREGEGALPALLDAVDDPSERVREWAAHMLGGIDDDRARAALEGATGDGSRIVRATAARALEADADRFRRQFTGAMDDTDRKLPGEDRLNRRPDL